MGEDYVLVRDICDESKVFKLNDGSVLALGRNRETQIRDTRCSRVHLRLIPDFEDRTVLVEHVGNNPSAVNGEVLRKGEKRKIRHNDVVEVLPANHFFKIEFCSETIKTSPDTSKISRSEQNGECTPSSSGVNDKKKTVTGYLDSFLKDPVVGSTGVWRSYSNDSLIIFTSNGLESRRKIASFDLDGTIITTVSGNVFAKNPNDWKIAFDTVVVKIQELYESKHKIVIFTNQSGIGRGKLKLSDFKKKVEAISRKLKVPIQVFIATMDDIYRKPRCGMWQHLAEKENDGLEISYNESFYCGDAAGRPAHCEANKKKKDFSVSDRLFAMNLKLKFFTPEEYFLGWKTAPFELPEFNPCSLRVDVPLLEPSSSVLVAQHQEVIVMVGCPGSGKTFFSKKYLESAGYVYVNRDTLKTWQKCVSVTEKSLKEKLSVVVDNTSPDKEARARYINVAKRFNVPVRAFCMKTTLHHAKHNNTFRQIKRDDAHDLIPNYSLNGFFNILERPTLEEGFSEIVHVNFIPHFESETDKKLYYMFLLD